MLKNKRFLTIASIVVLCIVLYFSFGSAGGVATSELLATVKQGEFVVDVTTTGELEAKNSTRIMGPTGLRNYHIWNVTIQDIIEEGVFVKKGDYVAKLDPSELSTKIGEAELRLDERESRYIQTQLDTTLEMRQERDKLINLKYAVEEKELILEQSQYEPPASIKQAEIELQKAKRALSQAIENLDIKRRQNVAKMQQAYASRQKQRNELQGLLDLRKQFVVKAPEDGMLIYLKGYRGSQIQKGSQISAWDPAVATLPDLSEMNSITYVNEVDIRRIAIGQQVEIGLDAFPEKRLTGKVTKVANVGEQRPNSDAKVFQVIVEIDKIDETLRPGMTTSNTILTNVEEETLFVPLECLHNHLDSITYVYRKSGIGYSKQEVQVGLTNANEAQILAGLKAGESVYLSVPNGGYEAVNLLPELNGKRNQKTQHEAKPKPKPMRAKGAGKKKQAL
ncbi:efflux RND transporter periplasmic adaptor subunit [Marinoscillum furvescens]|uniref:Multidrug resistance efflux pump n=1 Tax=Marinoscillum furvescens DSM 4134 TaxID=1122208 RepID=A0A3D9L0T6_MARFU|nr:efflux RND transporter periplasmic adaptor subunit [Marinoscillum furvescens]RED96131.1 multidrug resistance efflux pump [Marinoscillum furvescens DSM 4134]